MRQRAGLYLGVGTWLLLSLAGCAAPVEANPETVDGITEALATYEVGPGKPYANLQAVASLLKSGDTVKVYGGAT